MTEAPEADGFGQRGIGLGPAPGGGEDAAVVRAAEGRDGRKVPPLRDGLADPDPLIGARHVVGVLAGGEELAEDLLQHAEVVDVAARHRGERFVEEHHALLGPVRVDEARAEIRERHELEVAVAEAASQLERLSKALLLLHAIALEHAGVEGHPASLGGHSTSPASSVCARAIQPLVTAQSPTTEPYMYPSVRATRTAPARSPPSRCAAYARSQSSIARAKSSSR